MGVIFKDDQAMYQNLELMKTLRNNMIHKMFNARAKEAMHSFLERTCGRYGKKNSVALRAALKVGCGPGANVQKRKREDDNV